MQLEIYFKSHKYKWVTLYTIVNFSRWLIVQKLSQSWKKFWYFFFRSKSVLCGDTPFPWGWVVTGKIIKKYWTLTYNEFFLSSNERKMPKTILLLLQKKAFLYIITSIYVRLLMLLFENAHLLSYLCPNTSFFLQK